MNLDDLMAVWKSQDAAPLHDVNETLLRLALRQDEAKLQKWRRSERWIIYVLSAGFVAGMALFLANMILLTIYRDEEWVDRLGFRPSDRWRGRRPAQWARDVCGPPGAGAARATLWRVASRSTQPEYRATRLPGDDTPPDAHAGHCADGGDLSDSPHPRPLAAQREVHQRRWIHDRLAELNVRLRGGDRRLVTPPQARDVVLPHKRRLEALLKELDGQ